MKHKLFRGLVALVLVCVLVVNVSPIRAEASALPEAAGVVTKVIPFAKVVEPAALGVGGTVFCWVLMGLGVVASGYRLVKLYNDFQDFSGLLDVSLYYYPDGTWSYGVEMSFIEKVHAFIWKNGVVETKWNSHAVDSPCSSYADALAYARHCRTAVWTADAAGNPIIVVTGNIDGDRVLYDDGTLRINGNYMYHSRYDGGTAWTKLSPTGYSYYYDCKLIETSPVAPAIDGVSVGVVSPLEVPMPEAYPEWHTNSRPATNPDTDEEITVLPIPLNPSADPETQIGTLTQPDIWEGSIADPLPDTDPDTGTDVPPADIADYSVDLTSFFPFCLPFDIYAFFELLAAEPETPHLEFDIELPFMQEPWHVVIDLSAWDSTALLTRRLELLAFIIGLCVFTREKFLRS